jgi:putative transposase
VTTQFQLLLITGAGWVNQPFAPDFIPRCAFLSRSYDHDPLFEFHRWQANLRILEIESVPRVPYVPVSPPFVERLIGTVRREYLDRMFFWNKLDLEQKLARLKTYDKEFRVPQSLEAATPAQQRGGQAREPARLAHYLWESHCRGLFELRIAA